MNAPNLELENNLIKQGYKMIAGVDEVGRGPLAGPIVASAVILNLKGSAPLGSAPYLSLIRDSKKLSPKIRTELDVKIRETALSIGVGVVETDVIDRIGIGKANKLAFLLALANLKVAPTFIITDYLKLTSSDICLFRLLKLPRTPNITPLLKNQMNIKFGDAVSISIAAASIIAKVHRDKMMGDLHTKYPEYGFNRHKGYGTREHLEALKIYGPCAIHRKSFSPIRQSK
ncbi:MAG: ribonuclease HII [Candidatus Nealsonbacteria bacterium CG02_land_8_20_14_3_00_37_10]|uniref:Ribonuclease HII n=1 Tax=Candidatus Nealsonbacteria bacterium CG02_land_8_20_14_3_00_37_10 TaxID=1974699 RepID=A0A2M7D8T4_9BACT|nr:MAG: ribonuclease HII [Candidatus Nealsonbacteria bacterium CG02_land_8_20_14_3_00_37_10]